VIHVTQTYLQVNLCINGNNCIVSERILEKIKYTTANSSQNNCELL
jgi:hypothetical protein